MIEISNNELKVVISEAGAEMQSLRSIRDGREYLWQGDAKYWTGRSPILFPIVGGMWNGQCRSGDQVLRIPKHGFVKSQMWTPVEVTETATTLAYEPCEADLAVFPWRFRIEVTYALEGKTVRATMRAKNEDASTMWFQMGGHPGLALADFAEENAVDGFLRLEGNPRSLLRAGDQGCLEADRHPVLMTADGLVPLCVDTFANEALIFDDHQVEAVTLVDLSRRNVCRVASSAPVWLFWSPQGVHAPFVCAEPWYGLCDRQGFEGDISERPFIQQAEPGQTWEGWYTVEVL